LVTFKAWQKSRRAPHLARRVIQPAATAGAAGKSQLLRIETGHMRFGRYAELCAAVFKLAMRHREG